MIIQRGKENETMYLVELTPIEVWVAIAIIVIVAIIAIVRKRRAERDWEEHLRQKEKEVARFNEFFAKYKKQHPETWDENGNLHGSSKTKDK